MNPLDFLKPREVRWTLKELDDCLWSGPNSLYDLRTVIAEQCKRFIRFSDKTCYAIRVNGHTPRTLALVIAVNVTQDLLLSGDYHKYRGILSGSGHSLKQTLYHLMKLQLEVGAVTSDEVEQAKREIETEILAIG